MASLRQQLLDLIDRLTPEMEKAFLEAIEDIKSEIVLREIVERLERGDISGAVEALHIDPAAFRPLNEALRQAFNQGGILIVDSLPLLRDQTGGRVVVRWDVQNQRAEAIIRDLSSTMITQITEDTRAMAREKIVEGYAKGQGPNTIALDLAGRVDKATQKRMGGLLGMTSRLARTTENARQALSAGDVEGMKNYLTLTRRDKRFDRTVLKAIADEKPLDAATVQKIIGRLSDGYVKLRAETVARVETATSVNAAQHEAYQQGLDKAGRDASLVTRTWRSAGDSRVRHTHMVLNGQKVKGMDLPFQSPSGAMMRFPGDSSMGAGPEEIIGCRCIALYNFDFAEQYARSRGR